MGANYERYYFLTWTRRQTEDRFDFYGKLKARVPEGTGIYGCQYGHPSETGVVNYHALIVLPFVPEGERCGCGIIWGNWPASEFLRERLALVGEVRKSDTGEDEELRDAARMHIRVPKRRNDGGYKDLRDFLENAQLYIESDENKLLFGDRIDPNGVEVGVGSGSGNPYHG
jgi:hypothetical protein